MSGIHFANTDHPVAPSAARTWCGPRGRIPAEWKLAAALGLLCGILAIRADRWPWFGVVGAVLGIAMIAGRVKPGRLLRRLFWLSPVVFLAAIPTLVAPISGRPWWMLPARSGLCLLTAVVFGELTSMEELLGVFCRLRLPTLFITTLVLMHRYLGVLLDESSRMRRARKSRTFSHQRRWTWLVQANVGGHLFVRASERAERIFAAMCARGWR